MTDQLFCLHLEDQSDYDRSLSFWLISRIYCNAVVAVAGLGLAGGFAIIPFRKDIRFILLLAPLAGLLLTTLGALAFYVILKLSMRIAGFFSWSCCCCLTSQISTRSALASIGRNQAYRHLSLLALQSFKQRFFRRPP
jgi:hypothetical protein